MDKIAFHIQYLNIHIHLVGSYLRQAYARARAWAHTCTCTHLILFMHMIHALTFFLTDSLWTFYLTEISRITSLQHLNVETYTCKSVKPYKKPFGVIEANTILCSWIGKTRNLKKIEITVFNHCLFSSFLHILLDRSI